MWARLQGCASSRFLQLLPYLQQTPSNEKCRQWITWQAFQTSSCEKNTTCSAHIMETEAALRIWKRSGLYATPLQFTAFLSGGDSKAYAVVSSIEVFMEDCTNHIVKRLVTAFRKVKMRRGEKLKDATNYKLRGYFQVAIASNVRDTYCAAWASYFHSCPRGGASSHKFCPDREMPWCKPKRAQAKGQPASSHTPC